ncbi:hypothetical protein Pcinc_027580 [Petrolisthes cinctipes]|uniref:Uncharacterized protein n=1 Tax=Petrolisthes cinctipes TaxID=88211 RepID=A0AAE1F4R9_PETCI|nr:hypothetical protein Pcinc_027580 [Petrolisthes cinctipes]
MNASDNKVLQQHTNYKHGGHNMATASYVASHMGTTTRDFYRASGCGRGYGLCYPLGLVYHALGILVATPYHACDGERAADDATTSVCPPLHKRTYTVHVKGSRQARRKLQEAGDCDGGDGGGGGDT